MHRHAQNKVPNTKTCSWYQNMHIKHAYKLKYFSPFLSIINKGVKVKTKCSPPFCQKQKSIKKGVTLNKSIKDICNIHS